MAASVVLALDGGTAAVLSRLRNVRVGPAEGLSQGGGARREGSDAAYPAVG
ncbi:hypothetical protein GCM10023335_37580 [Streptomyces siamensis]|uniref:ATPase n=1 Tax=Streptomyces siamensis TaxID=1274986 RepID=A0ABP9IZN4_9ACTN